MLDIGLPSGGEFALLAVYTAVIYWIIRDFGAAAQAGFGLGSRIMQMIFLPAMAVAFAAAPIAGQNYGAKQAPRVRQTFAWSAGFSCAVMAASTALCQFEGEWMVRIFTKEPEVIAFAMQFLSIISFNFAAIGIVFTCSSMFQGLGNTWPSLASTGMRLVTFAAPAIWLSRQPGFQIVHVWYLSVATVFLQAVVSCLLLRAQLRVRLAFASG